MRRRAERDQDFEQVKQNLFEAGVSVVKAAQAHEEMFHTSLEALAEAYEGQNLPALEASDESISNDLVPIREKLLSQRQAAIAAQDVDAYLGAAEKLQRLKELAVEDIELDARRLEAQVRIANAQRQIKSSAPTSSTETVWTEKSLKAKYKTLDRFRQETGLEANKWKEAVEQMNQAI